MNEPHFEVFPERETISIAAFQELPEDARDAYGPPTGQYGWRFKAADGKISAVGGEGFTRREDARRAIRDVTYDVVRLVIRPAHGLDLVIPIVDLDEDGDVIEEHPARGGVVGGPPGPILARLPKGTHVEPHRRESA